MYSMYALYISPGHFCKKITIDSRDGLWQLLEVTPTTACSVVVGEPTDVASQVYFGKVQIMMSPRRYPFFLTQIEMVKHLYSTSSPLSPSLPPVSLEMTRLCRSVICFQYLVRGRVGSRIAIFWRLGWDNWLFAGAERCLE